MCRLRGRGSSIDFICHYILLYRSSTLGLLYYYASAVPADDPEKPIALFRPRRVGAGRIRIQRLIDSDLGPPKAPYHPANVPPKHPLSIKLAVTRENARRFLKSVIAHPHATHPDSAQAKQEAAKSKRRSWSPVKRTTSGEAPHEGGPPDTDNHDMRSGIRSSISGPMHQHLLRPRVNSDARQSASNAGGNDRSNGASPRIEATTIDSVIPAMDLQDEKPIASGNGVTVAIHLAEPVLFLQGFDSENSPRSTAMLRGSLHMRVTKPAKIKAVTLRFKGKATTKWPEGIPPRKVEFEETDTIMSHTWPFFNAQFPNAEHGTNADHVHLFKSEGATSVVTKLDPLGRSSPSASSTNLTSKEARKQLSLQVNQSRSFNKGDQPPGQPNVAAKGYRIFNPGDYIYNFELPLDSRLPESIDVELGSVKYELEAEITRSGAFRTNLLGTKEITLIRAPAEGSLEQVEPIAISRNWEDQLHYDIVISGKSFPLGSQVPIAFKLTPLAKVQCHRIKVLITENIEYFCSNKRVHRMEPARKVQLFEKRSDSAPVSAFPGSTMRITAGGGIPYDARAQAARGEEVTPQDTTNLLGDLEGDCNIGPTEMEFNVQLPSCHTMKDKDRTQRLHFDTTYSNIQVHHWIKIVMRLSKADTENPGKRRHFEISIDSPFHILSCRATQANISLPAYNSPQTSGGDASLYECGCPGAARRRNSPTSFVPTLNALNSARTGQSGGNDDQPTNPTPQSPALARPQQAHVHGQPVVERDRPIHLLRAPSFNPPAFDDEEPPPPLLTPPPDYGDIASPTNGLADYFARLSDAYDDSDEESRTAGRVNVPLTPGGRINRSMDIGRNWLPVGS